MGDLPTEFYSRTLVYQYMATAAATFGAFGLGTSMAWSSPALPDMGLDPNFSHLTKDDKSWIGAILNLGALVSGPATGFLIGRLGRKPTMMLMSAPCVLGWLLLIFAQNFAMLLAGRFITGFCGGSFSLASPVYIGEIAEGKIRGTLGSGFQMMVVLGILFVYCVGAGVNWTWLSIICGCVPVIFLALMMFMPESPRHLLAVGKREEAGVALAWFRGAKDPCLVEEELQFIQNSVEEQQRNQASFSDLLQPSLLKPTLISLGLMLFQQLSGINAVIFFVEAIFKDAGSDLSPSLSSIIVGIVQVIATLGSMVLIDKLGRRILLIFSDVLMGISLVALGIFFLLKSRQEKEHAIEIGLNNTGIGSTTTIASVMSTSTGSELDSVSTTEHFVADIVTSLGWLPLVSLMSFITAFSMGFGPIPWMLLGEILPSRAIGLASSISTSFNWTLAFLVTMFFEKIKEGLTIQWCYFMFAIICGIGVLYVLFIVPETKGKSLDEIQAMFGGTSELEGMMKNRWSPVGPGVGGAPGGRRRSSGQVLIRTNPEFGKD